ncbi:MAG TPA: hypothetical protein VEB59_07480 [Gemmatimonadales bacterium]|nr:hypothetical protein [Gemmatimonadales bacterium]
MPNSFKLSRRIARFRAPICAALIVGLVACDDSNSFTPDSNTPAAINPDAPVDPISIVGDDTPIQEDDATLLAPAGDEVTTAAVSFAGGIPMGTYALPTTQFGGTYNGGMRTIGPFELLRELAAIKQRGGKIVLMMAGSEWNYKDADGHFSLTKWKQRVDRFRKLNFQSYVQDGTIMAHYLIDEPYDPANWNGRPVPGATIEEMAKYSKAIWPNMLTVVRAEPYLIKWNGTYRHLDAAWAQYLWRKGNVNDYISRNVREAQNMGLGLVVGLNVRHGGNPNLTAMSPDEIRTWGSALLDNSYACAFLSWQWYDYTNTSAVRSAMQTLRNKAESRPSRRCTG